MITEIEDFFEKGCGRCPRFATPGCSALTWSAELEVLRRLCRDSGLSETVKWGQPCYRAGDRNVAILAAYRDCITLSFFNAALMKDPEGILERPGPNSATANRLRFDDHQALISQTKAVADYLQEAKGYAEAGILPPKTETSFELPDDLIEALDADPDMAEAFAALTPGRQRSYVIHLSSAKKQATRDARIAKYRAPILAGKGANER